MSFLNNDPYWVDVAEFLQTHLKTEDKIIAPTEFEDKFPGMIYPYSTSGEVNNFD